jgi:hypothetical protein
MQSSGKQPSELVNKDIANFISHNSGAAGNEDETMRLREFKVKVTNNAKKNYTDIINN